MPKLNLDSKKVLIISIVLVLVVSIGLILYYNNIINEQNKAFNEKLLKLNKELSKNIGHPIFIEN